MKSRALDAAMLPDVSVVCGDIEPGATSGDDPRGVFEPLAPGTEARNRPHLEVDDRMDGPWQGFRVVGGRGGVPDLPAIGVALPLVEIDRRGLSA